jgi:hypothetical protein
MTKEPFTELKIENAQSILLGRVVTTTSNTVFIKTSAKISSKEIQELLDLGFEEFDISPDVHYTTNVLLIWRKDLPAYVKEGITI